MSGMSLYEKYDDQQLSALLSSGDEVAFGEIYRRNWQGMYNAAYKRLKNEAQCEDLIQNIFTDLWERRDEIVIENLPAYLHTAVRFQVIKYSSRHLGPLPFLDTFETTLVSPVRTDDSLLENEVLNLVKLWIAALPEKRREIFLMHYNEDLSSARIAEALGISQKTVQNQLSTATNMLRARLARILLLSLLPVIGMLTGFLS